MKEYDKLLEILCCPYCRSELAYNKDSESLICLKCKEIFMIIDGIPVMLKSEESLNEAH